jgi:hypothetical protein
VGKKDRFDRFESWSDPQRRECGFGKTAVVILATVTQRNNQLEFRIDKISMEA